MNRSVGAITMATVLSLGLAGWTFAGRYDHPKEAKFTMWVAAKGTVQSVDAAKKTIDIQSAKGKVRTYPLDSDVRVLKDGGRVDLSDVNKGDAITFRYQRAGQTITTIKL